MLLTPLNYFFSMQLVPVFEWERVNAPDGATPPAPCVGAPIGDGYVAEPPSDEPASDLRLVFKGYEWRSVAERAVFAREDWESVYRSEADAREEERDPRSGETARRPTVQLPKPASDALSDTHANPCADKTGASET